MESNLWDKFARRRYSRRAVGRGLTIAGAGGLGLSVLACNTSKSTTGSSATKPASSGQTKNAASLIGRTGKQETNAKPVYGGTLNIPAAANPPTLDPQTTTSSLTMTIMSGVMSRLLAHKPAWDPNDSNNNAIDPDLASSAESPDAVTWTLKLQPQAKFQNVAPVSGHPVQAEDVKVTFTRALQSSNPNSGGLGMIDPTQIQSPAPDTVVFKLKYPYAPFPHLLSSTIHSWIFPREVATGGYDPTKVVIGSGPFLLDSYTPDVATGFKKNPTYFVSGKPYVDEVKAAIIPDAAQRYAQFTSGHLDLLTTVPVNDLPTLRSQNPSAEVLTNWDPGDGQVYFQLGAVNSPFQDIRARRGVSMAIQRDAIGKTLYNNQFSPNFNVPFYWGRWALTMDQLPADAQQYYNYDPAKAKQLLSAAGVTASAVDKLLYPTPYPTDPSGRTEAETVSSMINQSLDWKVNLTLINYNTDWIAAGKGVRQGNFPGSSMVFAWYESRVHPDVYLFDFWDSQSTSNQSALKDPQLDSLISKARAQTNDDQAISAYLDVQKYIAQNMYSAAGNPSGVMYSMNAPAVHNYLFGDQGGLLRTQCSNIWLTR